MGHKKEPIPDFCARKDKERAELLRLYGCIARFGHACSCAKCKEWRVKKREEEERRIEAKAEAYFLQKRKENDKRMPDLIRERARYVEIYDAYYITESVIYLYPYPDDPGADERIDILQGAKDLADAGLWEQVGNMPNVFRPKK